MADKKTSKAEKGRKGNQGGSGRFKPNDPETGFVDPRINRTGQNRKFTEFHQMLDRIFSEELEIRKDDKKIGVMSVLENMARLWLVSQDYNKQNKLLEYFIGKVPDVLDVRSGEVEDFLKTNLELLTDGQIERLRKGESGWVILTELLKDASKVLKDSRSKVKDA